MCDDDKGYFDKSSMIAINSTYFELGDAESTNNDLPVTYDPNRRSSLGAESLLEHDVDESGLFDEYAEQTLLDPSSGLDYADDIFLLSRRKEPFTHPQNFLQDQPQVTEYMRCTLVNWLVKVNHELRFGPETIFIAVSLTDRFLASTPIAHDCLQLLAVCALCVAAKLEETAAPGISLLVSLCGSTYRPCHFRKMEVLLLSTLQFKLHSITSWYFVTYLVVTSSRLAPLDRRTLGLSRYVIETCLGSYRISQFIPSQQAAASLTLSCLVIYAPDIVYPTSGEQDHPRHSTPKKLENVDAIEILSGINDFSSSLLWTFKNLFLAEEFFDVISCYNHMKDYMKSFLSSYFSLSGLTLLPNSVGPSMNNSTYNEELCSYSTNESNTTHNNFTHLENPAVGSEQGNKDFRRNID